MPAPKRQLRGPRLVAKVLEAAIEELSTRGYAALSIEDVAERANVAKTTIYRRWPTKAELVRDALVRASDAVQRVADTGTLRGDLHVLLSSFRTFATTPRGQSLLRMMAAERLGSELSTLVREIRRQKEMGPLQIVQRAIVRGELPRGTNAQLVVDTLFGALQHYVLFAGERPSDKKLRDVIELVLVGAQRGGAARRRR